MTPVAAGMIYSTASRAALVQRWSAWVKVAFVPSTKLENLPRAQQHDCATKAATSDMYGGMHRTDGSHRFTAPPVLIKVLTFGGGLFELFEAQERGPHS